ncbi:MAG TPA: MoxR family ATPase, partial [Clostridiaceae bacterium]|nr:MoxR family ATPase [Clostridiaceae bacterium]
PLFSNIILADEINRATPRTQSSLLEAMEEKQISVDGVTRELDRSFMVLATQNPVESHGTFPLPEAQLDRFFMRIAMGYPDREEEKLIALRDNRGSLDAVRPAVTPEELDLLKEALKSVKITDDVMGYVLDIVEHTRKDEKTLLGVSPRGSIALTLAAKALALTEGRDHVLPEDVKTMARYTLNHRIILKGQRLRGIYTYMDEILQKVPVPLEKIEA